MRKLILAMFVSVDGFIEGPNGELVPPAWSDDLEKNWSGANLDMAGAILYGRVCYEGMAAYWQSTDADPQIAGRLENLQKYVVSTTVRELSWKNTTILNGDIAEKVSRLKSLPGKDIVSFGGAGLAASLMRHDLVDEYRLMVTPIVLGAGKPLFAGQYNRCALELVDALTMDTGAVIIHYRQAGN